MKMHNPRPLPPVLVGRTNVTTAVAAVTFVIGEFPAYQLVAQNVVPATDGDNLMVRFGVDGTVLSGLADYGWGTFGFRSGLNAHTGDASDSEMQITSLAGGIGSATSEGCHAIIWVNGGANPG